MSQKPHSKASPGVLAINPSATQKGAPATTSSRGHSSKANVPRLKLHVRRLPPGMTQGEFESALGDHWKVGRGKIDWFLFKEGKVSTDPSKPSRPGRAYLRVTSSVTIPELSDVIRQTPFQDARNSYNDSALLGPPTLEYAPFSRVPSGKVRNDARVGTIDQDAEFIAFLESLTNPVTKPSDEETESAEKVERPAITPLIQYLRDKKANKAKEAATSSKPSKQSRSAAVKESKADKSHGKKQLLSRAEKSTSEKQKKDKATKDAAVKDVVKATNKQAANGPAKPENKGNSGQSNPPTTSPAPERRRERGNLSAATKILRRDLGLTAAPSRRREKAGQSSSPSRPNSNTSAAEDTKKDRPSSSKPEDNKPASTPKTKGNADSTPKSTPGKPLKGTPPTEPAAARNAAAARRAATPPSTGPSPNTKTPGSSGPKNQQQQQQQQKQSSQSSTAITQAFLKHANPSQGVTEDLLEKGFSQFGKVIHVEIDKKKGFGQALLLRLLPLLGGLLKGLVVVEGRDEEDMVEGAAAAAVVVVEDANLSDLLDTHLARPTEVRRHDKVKIITTL
ncbi:nonsense-mediated mRNA decay protein Upf3 [Arthroderma uncinatum]|uniref:nonsense-mediated mRNA decay protein Upf3 n=1 Tax=Arthroderma uncinatum TaxID=74035 RepID=UPI00144ABD4D|nr:nonsense-mediated mRNA decay protein Upf3 [Arthroderma uncinatum]KAF3490784.1 nonsense-mediated mRNA decay protein Upf3 [Arthroderma uncinatum]